MINYKRTKFGMRPGQINKRYIIQMLEKNEPIYIFYKFPKQPTRMNIITQNQAKQYRKEFQHKANRRFRHNEQNYIESFRF